VVGADLVSLRMKFDLPSASELVGGIVDRGI
jgi:hypothetical protein